MEKLSSKILKSLKSNAKSLASESLDLCLKEIYEAKDILALFGDNDDSEIAKEKREKVDQLVAGFPVMAATIDYFKDEIDKINMLSEEDIFKHEKAGKAKSIADVFVDCDEVQSTWFRDLFSKELDEIKGTISNERLFEKGFDDPYNENPHTQNIITLQSYADKLESLINLI